MNEAIIELVKKAYVEILSIMLALLGYFINSAYNKVKEDQQATAKRLDSLSEKVSILENTMYKEILTISEDKIGHCQRNMEDRIKSLWKALDSNKASVDVIIDSFKKDQKEIEKKLHILESSVSAVRQRVNMNKREGD